jgi:valyl-tRNA synthetase
VTAPEPQVALVEAVRRDLTNAGRIQSLTVVPGDGPLTVDVVLAETPAEG